MAKVRKAGERLCECGRIEWSCAHDANSPGFLHPFRSCHCDGCQGFGESNKHL